MDGLEEALLEKKWRRFLGYRFFFRFIPFLDFVMVAGSLALRNVHKDSDFDVIVGAREGKIFTVRSFCVFIFGILGIRRRGIDHKLNSSDKICLNHFVTPKAYQLRPPYNNYWVKLYQNLEPVYGKEKAVKIFFEANNWVLRKDLLNQKYWENEKFNFIKNFLEFILNGPLGNFFENFTKKIQVAVVEKRIRGGALGYKPRIHYNDKELEFHPDTRRIEEFIKKDLSFD